MSPEAEQASITMRGRYGESPTRSTEAQGDDVGERLRES